MTDIREVGFKKTAIFAVEGFFALLPQFDKIWRDPVLKGRMLTLLEWIETEPSVIGVSEHLLGVAWKNGGR